MSQKILTHRRYPDERIKGINNWMIDDLDKKDINRFIEDYKQGEVTGRIGTNIDTTIERVLQLLRVSIIYLSKNKKHVIGKFTKKDVEYVRKFKEDLLKDKIKSSKLKDNPYSIKGKKMLLATLNQYLRWKLKPEDYIILSKPLRIRIETKKPEPQFLTIQEIDKLYKNCKDNRARFIIANLFGSGTRAEEFINLRYSDYTLPSNNENYVKIRVREGYSKTGGRTISLYYDKCLEATRDYLEERKMEGIEPDDPIIKESYESIKKWLGRYGQRILNKNTHFHLFRSSCASWLANRLNRQQLCYFFAWKFNSSMPDTYISRKGLIMDDVEEKFERTEMEDLKKQLDKEKSKHNLELDELKSEFSKLKDMFEFSIDNRDEIDWFRNVNTIQKGNKVFYEKEGKIYDKNKKEILIN